MSRPVLIHYIAFFGKRASLIVATISVILLSGEAMSQGKEAIDAINHAGGVLAKSDNSTLLGIISIMSMLLAGFFGWIDKTAIQVIQTRLTEIEGHLRMRRDKANGDGA